MFATDLSSTAKLASRFALDISRRYDGTLWTVYVLPPATPPAATTEQGALRDEIERSLEDGLGRVNHKVMLEKGEVWTALARLIEENEIDLLIVGTRGRSEVTRGLLGSVAKEIFCRASCPLLTVGPDLGPKARLAVDLKRVLYATDFSFDSLAAVPLALSVVRMYGAELVLLHATDKLQDDHVGSAIQTLGELVPFGVELAGKPKCLVERGKPADIVLKVSGVENIDMIVLGLANDAAYQIAAKAECPVLTARHNREVVP